jgi:dTDP-4-dehydrorhamnose reductase
MKILVLGSGGMLGSDLTLQLGNGHFVIGMSSSDCDITLPEDCRRAVAECSPDVVVNAAAYTDVDGCETNRERCFAVNAEGVKNIASACRKKGVLVVHFSTDYVFDGSKKTPYFEEDNPSPINMYGSSKLQGERFLREASDSWLLIRTSWLYGLHGKNFVKMIMEKSSAVNNLEVVNDQVGSPTYAADLATAVKILIEAGKTGTYNFTNRGQCSWHEFACRILQLAGRDDIHINAISSKNLKRAALRPAWSVLSTAKYFKETGKNIRYWDIALNDYLIIMGYAGKKSNVLTHAKL